MHTVTMHAQLKKNKSVRCDRCNQLVVIPAAKNYSHEKRRELELERFLGLSSQISYSKNKVLNDMIYIHTMYYNYNLHGYCQNIKSTVTCTAIVGISKIFDLCITSITGRFQD